MTPNATRLVVLASFFVATLGFAAVPNASPTDTSTPPAESACATLDVQDGLPLADATPDVDSNIDVAEQGRDFSGEPPSGFESVNDSGHASCGHGIKACDKSQVGQPCDPNNLNIICSKQSNGHYCCLAYAP